MKANTTNKQTIIIGCSNGKELAKKIAQQLKINYAQLITKDFPDGELYIRYPVNVGNKHVVLVQSMHPNPNKTIMETILATKTARKLGAKRITLVAPYLAYLRQDKMFHQGECVSNEIIAELLSTADNVVTIDPHLHRINKLSQIFTTKTTTLSAMNAISEYLLDNNIQGTLIGPDIESTQWASQVAQTTGLPLIILHKKRYTPRSIRTKVNFDVKGKNIIIIDDIVSTGRTMIEPIKQLKKLGANKILCISVHGLFVENALQLIKKNGANIISTNTIQTQASKIDVSKTIAEALRRL